MKKQTNKPTNPPQSMSPEKTRQETENRRTKRKVYPSINDELINELVSTTKLSPPYSLSSSPNTCTIIKTDPEYAFIRLLEKQNTTSTHPGWG
jgi:hypothetical protein